DRVLVMSHGAMVTLANVDEGVGTYEKINSEVDDADDKSFLSINEPIVDFNISLEADQLESGQPLTLRWGITSTEQINDFRLRIFVYNAAGKLAADAACGSSEYGIHIRKGISEWKMQIASMPFKRGTYQFGF